MMQVEEFPSLIEYASSRIIRTPEYHPTLFPPFAVATAPFSYRLPTIAELIARFRPNLSTFPYLYLSSLSKIPTTE